MKSTGNRKGLGASWRLPLLLATFFVLATLYNGASTPFEAPDEIGHYYYTIYLARTGKLPVMPPAYGPPNYEHEGSQAPLYYIGAAGLLRVLSLPWWPDWLQIDLQHTDAPFDVNPYSTCAQPGARNNVAYFDHDLHQERFPYQGRVRALHWVRLWSTLLGMLTVVGVFKATQRAFPSQPAAAWMAAGLTALTPEFIYTAAAANNDNLVVATSVWGVWLALITLEEGVTWRRSLALGAIAALACLSKLSGIALLPLALAAIALNVLLHDGLQAKSLRRASVHGALASAMFLIITGWWFARNWRFNNDLLGLGFHYSMLPTRSSMSVGRLIAELPGLFRSWWGVFGCTAPASDWFYLPLGLILATGIAGLVVSRRELWQRRWAVALLFAWLSLMVAAYIRWNWTVHAPKGRLLYPALVSVYSLIGLGVTHWIGRRRWAILGGLALLATNAFLVAPLILLPTSRPLILPGDRSVDVTTRFEGTFRSQRDDIVTLKGYDPATSSYQPGDVIDLTLYWHVLTRPEKHYTLAIQLVSAVPGETRTLVNLNAWTGNGFYPSGHWRPDERIADRYQIELPQETARAQAWRLQVVLFDERTGERLPVVRDDHVVGDAALLAPIRVGASQPELQTPPHTAALAEPVTYGDSVSLEGWRAVARAETLTVTLWWHVRAPLSDDHVAFVHLYDAQGKLLATADGPVLSGGFPASLWASGDWIEDRRIFAVEMRAASTLNLGIGWYDTSSGQRLPAMQTDRRLPNDAYITELKP